MPVKQASPPYGLPSVAAREPVMATVPEVPAGVRAQRALLHRVVRYLVADEGIGQLLDVGAGLFDGLELVAPGLVRVPD